MRIKLVFPERKMRNLEYRQVQRVSSTTPVYAQAESGAGERSHVTSEQGLKGAKGINMNETGKRFLWVAVYAVAMAYLEAAVVIYLRALLHIELDHVSLGHYFIIEVGREGATIAMLVAVGWIAGRKLQDRLAYAAFAFGLWDIWYYVWLAVLIGWPETLFDWDILFLIPLRWWGPVLSPVVVALLLCIIGILAVIKTEREEKLQFTPTRLVASALGGLLVLYVFMADAIGALMRGNAGWDGRPSAFNWPLFLLAMVLMAVPSLRAIWPWRRNITAPPSLSLDELSTTRPQ